MGADRVKHGTYRCSHGCQIGGECPGHTWEVWYREGFTYIKVGEQDYRNGIVLDANLFDAITACDENHL